MYEGKCICKTNSFEVIKLLFTRQRITVCSTSKQCRLSIINKCNKLQFIKVIIYKVFNTNFIAMSVVFFGVALSTR